MALRGDRTISPEMRQRVMEAAEQVGYHSNAYVNVLMTHIRSGKRLTDQGVIAMLVNAASLKEWHDVDSYRVFHEGVMRRSVELGFHVESFFLRDPNTSIATIERILQARGIQGIILAPPYQGNRILDLHWERYAAVGVGFGWEEQELDRVAFDNLQNFITAFQELLLLGYRRIGTVVDRKFTRGNRCGIKWFTGYLECQHKLAREYRIPMFAETTAKDGQERFRKWYEKWRPDALLTQTGREREWLDAMNVRVPDDVGLACLAQPSHPHYARIDEDGEEVGATALELVVSKIARNEFGPPIRPKITMIEGRWVDGVTVRKQNS